MWSWYRWAAAFVLLMSMQAFGIVDRLLYGEWLGKPGNKITQAVNLLMILVSMSLFGRGVQRLRSVQAGAGSMLALCGLFLCSAAWSIDPATSIREGVEFLFVTLGFIGIATNLDTDECMDTLARIGFWTALASLVLFVVNPAAAHSLEGGDFRGIFSQKNVLGQNMAVGAFACLHGLRAGKSGRLRNFISLALVSLVAVMSQSATSCLTIFAFCCTDLTRLLLLRGGPIRMLTIIAVAIGSPLLVAAAISPDLFLEAIGKDPTLTGRTDIWSYVIDDIYQRPWLGWGYLSFWSMDNPAAVYIADALKWFPPQAHNGLLEILLYVGIPGAAYMMLIFIRNLWLAVQCLSTPARVLGMSGVLCCAGIILLGISETVLIDPFESSSCIFYITGLFCERALKANKATQRRRALPAGHFA